MQNTLILKSGNKTFKFQERYPEWCSVFLKHDRMYELGADRTHIVVDRFLKVLDIEHFPEATHSMSGYDFTCFIMLYEKHTSGYARLQGSGLVLHFRDGNGTPIDDLCLHPIKIQEWKYALTSFKDSVLNKKS